MSQPNKTKKKHQEMNEEERYMNEEIIQRMNKRVNFLKNPRFKESKRPVAFTDLSQRQELITKVNDNKSYFKANPSQVIFRDYVVGTVYEMSLVLTNTSKVLKRLKYLPPACAEFAIGSIKYPSETDGYVAPGMSMRMTINFCPSSAAEFDDVLTILTEDNIFKVPILARKELPKLNLPESLDCKSCWLGDSLNVKFTVTNSGGEAGYEVLNANSEDEIQVGDFRVSPSRFFLAKGQSQEISVGFKPSREGESSEDLILSCDNQTQQTIKVVGSGNTVELAVSTLDGVPLGGSEILSKIFFQGAIPNKTTQRKLAILNKTSVQVRYHWNLLDVDNESNFTIEPDCGSFLPDQTIEFVFSLKSSQYVPLFENANLIIDDIPIEAIRNPPESLKAQMGQTQSHTQSQRPSLTYFEFEMISFSSLVEVEIVPPFYVFPNSLSCGIMEKKEFKIINNSECDLQYEVIFDKEDHMISHVNPQKGQLMAKSEIQLELGIGSEIIAKNQKITYQIDFDYSHSQSIEMLANFEAAQIRVDNPNVNFNLIRTNSKKSVTVKVQNISTVAALVEVKAESGTPKLSFTPELLDIPAQSSIDCVITFNSFNVETFKDLLLFEVKGGQTTVLEVFAEVQSPVVSLNRVLLDVECLYSSNTYTFDERAAQNIVLQNLGNIPTKFKWEEQPENTNPKYNVKFEPSSGIVQPKCNMPIKFSIKPQQGGPLEELFVCDVEGLEFPLGFELKTKVLGLSVEYELIEEGQVDLMRDITSAPSSQQSKSPSQQRKSYFKQNLLSKTGGSKASSKSKKMVLELEEEAPQIKTQTLQKLEFFNCIISEPKQMKFLVRNTSGIHTQYRFYMEHFEPSQEDTINEDQEGTKSVATKSIRFGGTTSYADGKSSNSRSIIKKGKITQDGRPTVLLTDRIEKTMNFTSSAGQALNYKKKLVQDSRQYLSNNLGVAIVCEPRKGALPAYGSVVVTVTCFNDICGLFNDFMCAEIRGLDIVKFACTIDVKGSPLVITKNQLGINYSGDTPSFDLGTFMRNSGSIAREFRVTNTGPKDVIMDWKIYPLGGSTQSKYFDIKIVDPPLGSSKVCEVQFQAVEPPESLDGPFHIQPKQEKVKGRREKHFTIDFQTQDTGFYQAVLVGQPRFEGDAQLGAISLLVSAETVRPFVYLDKIPRKEDGHVIKFQKWSSGFNIRQEKRLSLVNKQKSGFVCTLELQGPFVFQSTSSSSPQKYELQDAKILKEGPQKTFNLVQNSHIEAVIRFEGPQPSNLQQWPMNYKVYNTGKLNIYFANGDEQSFDLEGVLLRPYIHLNTSGIQNVEGPQTLEFGTVHINNKKTLQFFISNLSAVPAQWKLNYVKYVNKKNLVPQTMTMLDREDQQKTDDQSVFEFQMAEGTLQGPSTMVHTLPHASALPHVITLKDIRELGIEPLKVLVMFKPKQNILYKSKYRITVQDGPSVEFILKGTGTYEENYEKQYD